MKKEFDIAINEEILNGKKIFVVHCLNLGITSQGNSYEESIKNNEAELILRNALRKEWQPILIKQYGLVKSSTLEKQLTFAESLSKDHDNHPLLLLTLGRLCMYNDLWGKARAYLEASIGNKELPETYKELGLLMEYLNEPQLAAEYFKKGLFLT